MYLNIAEVKTKQLLYDEALKYSNLGFCQRNGVEIQSDNFLALSSIYESRGDIKKALQYKINISQQEIALKYNDEKKIQLFQSLNDLDKSQYEVQN
jgi:hypothetical protein